MINRLTEAKKFQILGEVTSLMMASSLHENYRIRDVNNNIIPALQLNQFRIYKIGNKPIGFVSWAYLSDDIENKFTSEPIFLELEDWHSGDNLFFMDFMAPFGHARQIIQDLRDNIFQNYQIAKALRFKEIGNLKKVAKYYQRNTASTFT